MKSLERVVDVQSTFIHSSRLTFEVTVQGFVWQSCSPRSDSSVLSARVLTEVSNENSYDRNAITSVLHG